MYYKLKKKKSCWLCGSDIILTGEHKMKRTDLNLLFDNTDSGDRRLANLKFRTESRMRIVQSSNSDLVKFEKSLCRECNSESTQKSDFAYQKLIQFFIDNEKQISYSDYLDWEEIFGCDWERSLNNVYRYIGKHVGCRIIDCGFQPTQNLIEFIRGNEINEDLKVVFQIKLRVKSDNYDSNHIFLGPINPINDSAIKGFNIVTSFSGWYSFKNFTWNYLCERNIVCEKKEMLKRTDLVNVDYSKAEFSFITNEESKYADFGKLIESVEYYPFKGDDRDVEHYKFLKECK